MRSMERCLLPSREFVVRIRVHSRSLFAVRYLTSRPYCDFYRNSMAVNTQFSIATHIMASLGYASGLEVNSGLIAGSVNTSSSFVRRVLAKLSKAGLVKTVMGKGGACWLARPARQISLLEI